MKIRSLQNKLVAVLGFGQEGKATAQYLMKHGISPVLFDQRPWDDWPKNEQDKIKSLKVNFIFGLDAFKELAGFELAFRSPGIKILDDDMQSFIKKGLKVTSQTKWFFEHCPSKIIGVTGTKGKGTTASLIFLILNATRYTLHAKCYLTGNIGKDQPFEFLDDLTADDTVVYELSSFQLQDLEKSPHIAVVLKTFSEHMDYHKNEGEYLKAKTNIIKYQTDGDFAVINADDETARKISEPGSGQKIFFSTKQELKNGCFIKDDLIVVKNVVGRNIQLPISNIQLVGRHNLENVCAAVLASVLAGADEKTVVDGVKSFKGLPHRLELVAEKNGIKFYNDSVSTTPETTIAAIQSFDESLILILGGSSKNSDFKELGKTIRESKNIKALILVGQEAGVIDKAIGKTEIKILKNANNLEEIFAQIKQVAEKGDTVLLSPACASFDMFKNYQDRGEQFKSEIQKW